MGRRLQARDAQGQDRARDVEPHSRSNVRQQALRQAFAKANAKYYETVDWALDISEAQFEECDIRGIPAQLIKRDRDTQAIVTREKALQAVRHGVERLGYWGEYLPLFLERGDNDTIYVAGRSAPDFQQALKGLRILRDAGVAEAG